jgi:hypothetical protein
MLNSTNAGNAMAAQTGDLKGYRDFPGRGAEESGFRPRESGPQTAHESLAEVVLRNPAYGHGRSGLCLTLTRGLLHFPRRVAGWQSANIRVFENIGDPDRPSRRLVVIATVQLSGFRSLRVGWRNGGKLRVPGRFQLDEAKGFECRVRQRKLWMFVSTERNATICGLNTVSPSQPPGAFPVASQTNAPLATITVPAASASPLGVPASAGRP